MRTQSTRGNRVNAGHLVELLGAAIPGASCADTDGDRAVTDTAAPEGTSESVGGPCMNRPNGSESTPDARQRRPSGQLARGRANPAAITRKGARAEPGERSHCGLRGVHLGNCAG
jgi:hypothetical protein